MFERLFSFVIRSYLERFVELDANQLSVALWQGHVSLSNLQIKSALLQSLRLPFSLIEGTVGLIDIRFNWAKPQSTPITITVSDVFLVMQLHSLAMDVDEYVHERKQATLAAATAFFDKLRLDLLSSGSSSIASILPNLAPGLIQAMIDNIVIHVDRVHICVLGEHIDTVLGVAIDKINVQTTDQDGVPGFVYDTAAEMHRRIDISKFSVYCRPRSELERTMSPADRVTLLRSVPKCSAQFTSAPTSSTSLSPHFVPLSRSSSPLGELLNESHQPHLSSAPTTPSTLPDWCWLVRPCDISCRIHQIRANRQGPMRIASADTFATIKINALHLSVASFHLTSLLELVQVLNSTDARCRFAPQLPPSLQTQLVTSSQRAQAHWKFAISNVRRALPFRLCRQSLARALNDRQHYIQMYVEQLTTRSSLPIAMLTIERRHMVDTILAWRCAAEAQWRVQYDATAASRPNLTSWLTSWVVDAPTVNTDPHALTASLWSQLDRELHPTPSFDVSFEVVRFSTTLWLPKRSTPSSVKPSESESSFVHADLSVAPDDNLEPWLRVYLSVVSASGPIFKPPLPPPPFSKNQNTHPPALSPSL